MKKKFFLMPVFLALVFFACENSAKADTWTSTYFVDEATASQHSFDSAVKDGRGHKWFQSAKNGDMYIYEYTGTEWINHTDAILSLIHASYPNNDPNATIKNEFPMYVDKQGNLWIAPTILAYYDGTNWNLVNPKTVWEEVMGSSIAEFGGATFFDMFGDSQGNIYALSGANFTGMLSENSTRILKRTPQGSWSTALPNDSVVSYANQSQLKCKYNDATGDYWCYLRLNSSSGTYRYHGGTWTHYTTSECMASNAVHSMLVDSRGAVWATSNSGVSKFEGSSWAILNSSNSSLKTDIVSQVAEDSSGKVWLITNYDSSMGATGGASVFDPAANTWMYYSGKNGDDDLEKIEKVFFFGDSMWSVISGSRKFLILDKTSDVSTVYGQVGGAVVEKTAVGQFQQLKKAKTKKVTIYRRAKVKKKWKWKVTSRGRTLNGWYKTLNLPVGTYKIQIQGKKAKSVNITSGDPYRLNFK